MTSPFAAYANLRLRFERRRDAIPNFRDGGRVPTDIVVIDAWARSNDAGGGEQQTGGIALGQFTLTGFLVRYAVLPPGSDWLSLGLSWPWVETGLRPPGLRAGETLEACWGDLSGLPAVDDAETGWLTLSQISHPYGSGGIGARLRTAAGDKFAGIFAETR